MNGQESEALEMLESMLDVADMKNTGPMYSDDPPRSGLCRIPEDDAAKLRQYIADRRAAPENKPLTLDELRQMDGDPVWVVVPGHAPICEIVVENYKDGIKMANAEDTDDYGAFDLYGKTWLAYARRPEDAT